MPSLFSDIPSVRVKWAGAHSSWTPETTKIMLESKIEQSKNQIASMQADMEEYRGDMAVIGARLKSKFGSEVRLDDESSED